MTVPTPYRHIGVQSETAILSTATAGLLDLLDINLVAKPLGALPGMRPRCHDSANRGTVQRGANRDASAVNDRDKLLEALSRAHF
ncbi:MAG: hypothetical protein V3V08_14145 [Nannocystaceae bacterium]